MTNLIQTNIVGVFSVIDLLTVEKPLSDLFSIKKDGIDNIESAKAPNLLAYFKNDEKKAIILTANSLRVDNNNGEESTDFIEDFFKIYEIIKKSNSAQNIAYGFNFTYSITLGENKISAKVLRGKFLKPKVFSSKLSEHLKGAGVRLMWENEGIRYDLRFDPTAPESNIIQVQINANHNGDLPNKSLMKKSFLKDLKFVKEIINEIKIDE